MNIWGINKPIEDLTNDELFYHIDARLSWIEQLNRLLPYADHGAYGQDLDRISTYRNEIAVLRKYIK